jgi:hypothetical protein
MEHNDNGPQGRYAFAAGSQLHPVIYRDFRRILEAVGTPEERPTINEVYGKLEPANFSKQILERIAVDYPKSISVLPVREVLWSDLGSRERVLRVLRTLSPHEGKEIQAVPDFIKPRHAENREL